MDPRGIDAGTKAAVEKKLALELLSNARRITHKTLGDIILKRPTLEDEVLIGEMRRKSYQRDMKNPDVLSKAELESIAIGRGMWDPTIPSQIQALMTKTGEAMSVLEATGFKTVDGLTDELALIGDRLIALFPYDEELDRQVKAAIFRLANDAEMNPADRMLVEKHASSSDVPEMIEEIVVVRKQLKILEQFVENRLELATLQRKQAELFVDSIESRAEREQEYGTLYYCCLNAETGKPLWDSPDAMKRSDPEAIGELMTEYSYFTNGITPEFQEMLSKYGFLQRLSDTNSGSDSTPAQPESKDDGVATDEAPTDSSPVLALVPNVTTSSPEFSSIG